MILHAGIAPFTGDIQAPDDLAKICRLALREAQQYDQDCAMVRSALTQASDSRRTRSPIVPPELYAENDLFIQLTKLKNTLRHWMGEDLITHLGTEYYEE